MESPAGSGGAEGGRAVQISFYAHFWQALLMFIAGVVAVVCSFAGFLRTGGAEQLLQQALVAFTQTGGKASFRYLETDFKNSKLVVHELDHTDFSDGQNQVTGLHARQCEVSVDLWPQPQVTAVKFQGLNRLRLQVQAGFLQQQQSKTLRGPKFPVLFEDVDLALKVGDGPWLELSGCSGSVERAPGPSKEPVGQFNVTQLNGQPFDFHLATLGGGRWEFRGTDLAIDTRRVEVGRDHLPVLSGDGRLDPIELLYRSLLTGESGAEGTVSVQGYVQLASEGRRASCEGQVAYKRLKLRLPSQEVQAGVLPLLSEWFLGGRKTSWSSFLTADSIETGPDGRLAFHMNERRLEFACDEGPGSAFIARRGLEELAPLESLKGSIVTDDEYRPREVVLRGFLGAGLSGELRMRRLEPAGRFYEVVVQPRAGGDPGRAEVPLWRFHSWVQDCGEKPEGPGEQALVRFGADLAAMHFQDTLKLLPPGMRDVSGVLRFRGRYAADRTLYLDSISWADGGLVYGGPDPAEPFAIVRRFYGPVFSALKPLWGGGPAWSLRGVRLTGKAEARFDARDQWLVTKLSDWKLHAGSVVYEGLSTDLGDLGLEVLGEYARHPDAHDSSSFSVLVAPAKTGSGDDHWRMRLGGAFREDGTGVVFFEERDVPTKVHPERGKIDGRFINSEKRVFRKREVELKADGTFQLRAEPLNP
jgi:hypothetical protein